VPTAPPMPTTPMPPMPTRPCALQSCRERACGAAECVGRVRAPGRQGALLGHTQHSGPGHCHRMACTRMPWILGLWFRVLFWLCINKTRSSSALRSALLSLCLSLSAQARARGPARGFARGHVRRKSVRATCPGLRVEHARRGWASAKKEKRE
jgi:hypothetical protein